MAVSKDGKVTFKAVKVARDYGNKMEISQGLKAGETVLIDAPAGLNNGSSVQAVVSKAL